MYLLTLDTKEDLQKLVTDSEYYVLSITYKGTDLTRCRKDLLNFEAKETLRYILEVGIKYHKVTLLMLDTWILRLDITLYNGTKYIIDIK